MPNQKQQIGVGYPYYAPVQRVPVNSDISLKQNAEYQMGPDGKPKFLNPSTPELGVNLGGDIINNYNNGKGLAVQDGYKKKTVKVITVPLDVAGTFKYQLPGTILYAAAQTLIVGPFAVILDNIQNDPMPMKFGDYWSGIPFDQFWVYVATAQAAGTAVSLVVISDDPSDRVNFVEQ